MKAQTDFAVGTIVVADDGAGPQEIVAFNDYDGEGWRDTVWLCPVGGSRKRLSDGGDVHCVTLVTFCAHYVLFAPRIHRYADPVPTDPAARRALVSWLMAHKLWTYPTPHGDESGGGFAECVDIEPVYIDPARAAYGGRNLDNPERNTQFHIWIEAGGWHDLATGSGPHPPLEGWTWLNRYCGSHDTDLDCGAGDLETALCKLAVRVKWYYGDGREWRVNVPMPCAGGCASAIGAPYCDACGYALPRVSEDANAGAEP